KEFLKTKERFIRINKTLNIFLILFLTLPFLFTFGFRANAAKVFSLLSLVMFLLPVLGFYAWRLGYKEARFYTIAWSVWAAGMTAPILVIFGVDIAHDTATMSARLGLIFEATLLSFAISDQINILRNERNDAVNKYKSQRVMMEINSRQAQMGEMISAISHQWKQPLNLITITVQNISMTLDECDNQAPKEVYENIDSIKQVVGHMSSTIDDFKNFFSPSKRKTLFSPISMVHNILSMVGKQYEYLNISFDIEGDAKLTVFGRENELKQAALNLFNNAKDAFCSNEIKNRKIEVKAQKDGDNVLLTIKDNAGGIPKDVIGKIFDNYFTTKGEEGTGIGLYICKKIIEESFGGRINVYNGENGAIFCIMLPTNGG
ncbi:MAG TPA: HAMP domain-containing sensor histidine kinase, partial [Campylobacterales bacterium]|nr:HAMP domain-containing sensor histidine kinase [Campylobacterales bacterium]